MAYPINEVLWELENFKIKKFENRRFTVVDPDGNLLGPYATFETAKLAIHMEIANRKYGGKRMGEK